MQIIIKNCNNINEGNINITESKLNIKFGINGTGKSTIAKAIQYSIDDTKDLSDLTPFKFRGDKKGAPVSEVLGVSNINKVLVFNEEYIKKFTFQKEELIENSFDIFVKTPLYEEKIKLINDKIRKIRDIFGEDKDLEGAVNDLKELTNAFKTKASKGYKSLLNGNIIKNISKNLETYRVFLESKKKFDWINWFNKGNEFREISDCCPYCTSSIAGKKDQIKEISEKYDGNNIKNLVLLNETIEKLHDYFSDYTISSFREIMEKGLSEKNKLFLLSIKKSAESLIEKLEKLRSLSHNDFKDPNKVKEVLELLRIVVSPEDSLNSKKTIGIIERLNNSLDEILNKVIELQVEVGKQKTEVVRTIKKYEIKIDQFLRNAGYKYKVVIEDSDYKLKLKHIDFDNFISEGDQHLSFGERNAFALALFMYECLSKDIDLIILDDPISSFDNNKKYAIMDMLFDKENLGCRTVLMLTHDLEPVIDTIKIFRDKFKNLSEASFLQLKKGMLSEKKIQYKHILTFPKICNDIVSSESVDDILKLIYLRRYYEVLGDKGNQYQVISNLLHKANKKDIKDHRKKCGDDYGTMDEEDFNIGVNDLIKKVENFNYEKLLGRIKDISNINKLYSSSINNYEKLQLFRILDGDCSSCVMKNFIDRSYHVENEYINQLNPIEFDLIPEYIIEECDKVINSNK